MFFWDSLDFYDLTDVGILIFGPSVFSKSRLYIWKFSVHVLLKPSLKDIENYLASMLNNCSYVVVGTFFGFGKKTTFPVLWPLLSLPNLLAY